MGKIVLAAATSRDVGGDGEEALRRPRARDLVEAEIALALLAAATEQDSARAVKILYHGISRR